MRTMLAISLFLCILLGAVYSVRAEEQKPAGIEVVTTLMVPGKLLDRLPGALLLQASSGEALLVSDHLALRQDDPKADYLALGAPITASVPVDAAEVTMVDGGVLTMATTTGVLQLPTSLMSDAMLRDTTVYASAGQDRLKQISLADVIAGHEFSKPVLETRTWVDGQVSPGVIVGRQPNGDVYLSISTGGAPTLRLLPVSRRGEGDWKVGRAVVVYPDETRPVFHAGTWEPGRSRLSLPRRLWSTARASASSPWASPPPRRPRDPPPALSIPTGRSSSSLPGIQRGTRSFRGIRQTHCRPVWTSKLPSAPTRSISSRLPPMARARWTSRR